MKENRKIVNVLVKAMSITTDVVRPDYHAGISTYSENGLPGAVWDRRETTVHDALANSEGIETIGFKRGSWQVIVVLDKNLKQLYIMMSQANLDQRIDDFKREGTSSHYVYSLLLLNEHVEADEQLELLPLDEEYRKKDCQKILGEFLDEVDEVIIAAFDYEQVVTRASLYLFDNQFNVSEVKDISDLLVANDVTLEDNAVGDSENRNQSDDNDNDDDNGQMVYLK